MTKTESDLERDSLSWVKSQLGKVRSKRALIIVHKEFTCSWAIPILLTAMASLQIWLAQNTGLSPWKGGGFGMFSVIDRPVMRSFVCEANVLGGKEVILLWRFSGWGQRGPLTTKLGRSVRANPTTKSLQHLANFLIEAEYVPDRRSHIEMAEKYTDFLTAESNERLSNMLPRGLYRMAASKPEPETQHGNTPVTTLELRVRRVQFDADRAAVWCESFGPRIRLENDHGPSKHN